MDTHHDVSPYLSWWHPRMGPPPAVPTTLRGMPATEESAIRSELPYQTAAVLVQARNTARRRLAGAGDVDSETWTPRELPLALLPVADPLERLSTHRPPDTGREQEDAADVATACARVAEWAEGRGAIHSALAFAQLAVRTGPDAPRHAYDLGRIARRRGNHQAAWQWLRWALALSRREGDRDTLVRALAGMGAMYHADGQLLGATRYWRLALRLARERGPRAVEEEALQALALLRLRRGDLADGLDLAHRALDALSPYDLRVDLLARAVARHLVDTYGLFRPPLLLVDALLPHEAAPAARMALHALGARAAAGAGHHVRLAEEWSAVFGLAHDHRQEPAAYAAALLDLARAAAHARQWGRAEHALACVREVAPKEGVDGAAELEEALRAGSDREARLREAFPAVEVPEHAGDRAERFCLRAAAVLGARGRGEGPGAYAGRADTEGWAG